MTPPMVERVARAIYKAWGCEDADPWDDAVEREARFGIGPGSNRRNALAAALAALRAMREPTLTMLGDGETAIMYCEDTTQDSYGSYTWIDHRRAAVETWAAMIDAAINEGK